MHMRRIWTALLLLPALALFSGMAGCGKEEKPKTLPPLISDGGGPATDGPKTTIKVGTGKITGRVVYDGDPPTPASFTEVMTTHPDKKCCLDPAAKPSEKIDQTWFVNADKGVQYAVIWLKPPANAEFTVVPETKDAEIDQPHCVYIPHVLAMKPGQKLLIKNSAVVTHNTKFDVDELVNKKFGVLIPPGKSELHELKPQDRPINTACDIHGWMRASIWVMPHQYVAVTNPDGSFTIDNVPDGVELSVVAWHEGAAKGGYFHGGKVGTKLKLAAGETKALGDLKVSAP
jgi:hypothetical protein